MERPYNGKVAGILLRLPVHFSYRRGRLPVHTGVAQSERCGPNHGVGAGGIPFARRVWIPLYIPVRDRVIRVVPTLAPPPIALGRRPSEALLAGEYTSVSFR